MEKWNKWIKAAGIRAIKTMAQTAIATIGAAALLTDVDWSIVLSASLLAGMLSILTSIAGLPECQDIEINIGKADIVHRRHEDAQLYARADNWIIIVSLYHNYVNISYNPALVNLSSSSCTCA
jgi:hypothetical protein